MLETCSYEKNRSVLKYINCFYKKKRPSCEIQKRLILRSKGQIARYYLKIVRYKLKII